MQRNENWSLNVRFEKDRGNERMQIYKVSSCDFVFDSSMRGQLLNMQNETGEVYLKGDMEIIAKPFKKQLTRSVAISMLRTYLPIRFHLLITVSLE